MSGTRDDLLERLAALVQRRLRDDGLRVAIDGIDAAGKSTLADELAEVLRRTGVAVLRASIDGFHLPAAHRHRRAADGPGRSYYEDSFDYPALRRRLLDPLGPDGDSVVRTRVFDHRTDRPVAEAPRQVPPGTVLLFDGVFLLRPELDGCWDLAIFVAVAPATSVARARERDADLLGTADDAERRYRDRYLPGQELYRVEAHPEQRADVLIDNDDPAAPRLLRIPPA